MEVVRKYFDSILPDNEELYLQLVVGILESVDELSTLQITKLKDRYTFRLSPSAPKYNQLLLKELLKLSNLYHIHLDISKSIKTSNTINFSIGFVE